MSFREIVYRVQFQAARLEAVIFFNALGKGQRTILSKEISNDTFYILKESLLTASKECLETSQNEIISSLENLSKVLTFTFNCLSRISEKLASEEIGFSLMKELFESVSLELIALSDELNLELGSIRLSLPQDIGGSPVDRSFSKKRPSNMLSNSNSLDKLSNRKIRSLIGKCMGDAGQAERLIQYETQRKPDLDRESAIKAAIERWERDCR